jgi:hypothetical protein
MSYFGNLFNDNESGAITWLHRVGLITKGTAPDDSELSVTHTQTRQHYHQLFDDFDDQISRHLYNARLYIRASQLEKYLSATVPK